MPSARYHERMNATGRTDHHVDPDLDAEQLLGLIPRDVLQALWPGFVPQDSEVFVNLINLRRHLQGRPDFVYRVAVLNQYAGCLSGCLANASVFARYELGASNDAGVTAYVGVPGAQWRDRVPGDRCAPLSGQGRPSTAQPRDDADAAYLREATGGESEATTLLPA